MSLLIKLLLLIFSMMSLRLNHFIGGLVGKYLYFTNTKIKSVVSKNIKLCFPELNAQDSKILIKKSLISAGQGLTELGFIWFKSFKSGASFIKKIDNINYLTNNTPTILLVPHFGCWEIVGRVVSLVRPITFLYKPLKVSKLEQLVFSKRNMGALSMVTADKKGILKMQRAMVNGSLIGILPDQNPHKEGSILAPFFTSNIPTMTLLVKIARKNNAKVIMAWASRLENGSGYELKLKPVDILSKSGDINLDVALMNKVIEDLVRTKPEQYLWGYKRFSSTINYK